MKTSSFPRITLPALSGLIPIAVLLIALAATLAPWAQGQVTFIVQNFTNNAFGVEIKPDDLRNADDSTSKNTLSIFDADNPANTNWILSGGSSLTDTGNNVGTGLGSANFSSMTAVDSASGDYVSIVFDSDLSGAGDFTTGLRRTLGAISLNLGAISNLGLYWGLPTESLSTLQSISEASQGSTSSPVPEPGSFSLLVGLVALSWVASRRRL